MKPALRNKTAAEAVANGPPKAMGAKPNFSSFGARVRRARVNNTLQRSQAWSIWQDLSGAASEDNFDNRLSVVGEVNSSAQFHATWSKLKRDSMDAPAVAVRIFRAGVLPFRTLSKNREGGDFQCDLHSGTDFSEAASSFATVTALLIDGDLRMGDGVNGVCLLVTPAHCSIQLWAGSGSHNGPTPIESVLEQLNTLPGLMENLKDPATFRSRRRSVVRAADAEPTWSPVGVDKLMQSMSSEEGGTQASAPEMPRGAMVYEKPVSPASGEQEAEESVADSASGSAGGSSSSTAPEGTPSSSSKKGGGKEPPKEPEKVKAPKSKKAKKKVIQPTESPSGAASASASTKKELSEEEKRARALAEADRDFLKSEGEANWSRERSIAWLWLLAFPLVYIVIGWLFCLIMNNTNPGAYPKWFSL